MTFPVAMIPYTNMAPYRELGPPAGCRFVSLVPSRSIAALKNNSVIAAAAPVGGLPELAGLTDFLGCFGIAAIERSLSVLFFSKRPLADLGSSTRIRVTDESASSVRLLYLLLSYHRGRDDLPRLAAPDETADGELLIGDRALLRMDAEQRQTRGDAGPAPDSVVTDLASAWYARQKLPFVFARWVVRRDAPPQARAALESWLSEFKAREEELVGRAVPAAAEKLNLEPQTIRTYFRVLRRCLDETDLAGQARFLEECRRYTLTAAVAWRTAKTGS
jgi:predicted solute-binding protein